MGLMRGVEFAIGYLKLLPHEADRLRAAARVTEKDMADAQREARLQRMREEDEVTDSCGCVFCDLDDVPEMINGALKHHYQGPDGRLVPCTKAA